jgi:hypothetical protein
MYGICQSSPFWPELLEMGKIQGKEGAKARYQFILEHGEKRCRVHTSISKLVEEGEGEGEREREGEGEGGS